MSPTAEQVRDMVLSKAGFLKRDGSRRDGLIDVREAETQVDTQLRYGGLFREMAIESTSSDLVYETPSSGQSPGTPCIYLKVLSDPSPHSVAEVRSRVWNHGRIPTLWIISDRGVRIITRLPVQIAGIVKTGLAICWVNSGSSGMNSRL